MPRMTARRRSRARYRPPAAPLPREDNRFAAVITPSQASNRGVRATFCHETPLNIAKISTHTDQTPGGPRAGSAKHRRRSNIYRSTSPRHRSKQPETGLNRPLNPRIGTRFTAGLVTHAFQISFYDKHDVRGAARCLPKACWRITAQDSSIVAPHRRAV